MVFESTLDLLIFTLKFLMAILATYGVTFIVTITDGPFDIFEVAKIKLGAYLRDHNGQPKPRVLGKLISCPFCFGVWVAAFVTLIAFPLSKLSILIWLSVTGGQIYLQSRSGV